MSYIQETELERERERAHDGVPVVDKKRDGRRLNVTVLLGYQSF